MIKADKLHGETDRVIRASDIAAYTYCAHAWWLGPVKGRRSKNTQSLEVGLASHERHGRRVTISYLLMRLSTVLLLLAGLAAAGWAVSLLGS